MSLSAIISKIPIISKILKHLRSSKRKKNLSPTSPKAFFRRASSIPAARGLYVDEWSVSRVRSMILNVDALLEAMQASEIQYQQFAEEYKSPTDENAKGRARDSQLGLSGYQLQQCFFNSGQRLKAALPHLPSKNSTVKLKACINAYNELINEKSRSHQKFLAQVSERQERSTFDVTGGDISEWLSMESARQRERNENYCELESGLRKTISEMIEKLYGSGITKRKNDTRSTNRKIINLLKEYSQTHLSTYKTPTLVYGDDLSTKVPSLSDIFRMHYNNLILAKQFRRKENIEDEVGDFMEREKELFYNYIEKANEAEELLNDIGPDDEMWIKKKETSDTLQEKVLHHGHQCLILKQIEMVIKGNRLFGQQIYEERAVCLVKCKNALADFEDKRRMYTEIIGQYTTTSDEELGTPVPFEQTVTLFKETLRSPRNGLRVSSRQKMDEMFTDVCQRDKKEAPRRVGSSPQTFGSPAKRVGSSPK